MGPITGKGSSRTEALQMAEKLDAKKTVSFEELPMSNVYTQEALINLLDSKGIISKADK